MIIIITSIIIIIISIKQIVSKLLSVCCLSG